MRVFLSWSGERSKAIADIVRRWLPGVLQAVKPYYSPDDVAKGSRWSGEIAKELEVSRVGLLILTPENTQAPWLMFEAGALAKNLDRSKVCPILFGLEPTDITGPLVQFQASRFEVSEIKRVVKMINAELGDAALAPDVLETVFDMWWPQLDKEVRAVLAKNVDKEGEASRTEKDMLEEVLALTRTMTRARSELHPGAIEDLVETYTSLLRAVRTTPSDPAVVAGVERMRKVVEYLGRRGGRSSLRRLMHELDEPEILVSSRQEIVKTEPEST